MTFSPGWIRNQSEDGKFRNCSTLEFGSLFRSADCDAESSSTYSPAFRTRSEVNSTACPVVSLLIRGPVHGPYKAACHCDAVFPIEVTCVGLGWEVAGNTYPAEVIASPVGGGSNSNPVVDAMSDWITDAVNVEASHTPAGACHENCTGQFVGSLSGFAEESYRTVSCRDPVHWSLLTIRYGRTPGDNSGPI